MWGKELALGINQLRGPVPSELGNLANLEGLRLNSNQLTRIHRSETSLSLIPGMMGIGKANGPGQIPIDGDEGGVKQPHWHDDGGRAAMGAGSIGGRQEVSLADRVGASWRGRWVAR